MTIRYCILAILIVCGEVVNAAGIFNRIQRALEQQDYEKVEKLARKSLEKDTINPGARYYLSVLFLTETFPAYNVDSARTYIHAALADFELADAKSLDKLIKAELFLRDFTDQKAAVAAAGFEQAHAQMTIDGFKNFLALYPDASEVPKAIYLRDSLAYVAASVTNTWQAYKAYLLDYPDSEFSSQAQDLYQKLLFKDKTQDDQLSSYVKFLAEHPETPFRAEAEKVILIRSTIKDRRAGYLNFIASYPKSHLVLKAADHLYATSTDRNDLAQVLGVHPRADSVRQLWELEQDTLFAVMSDGKFGFMNLSGKQVIPSSYSQIDPELVCGGITDKFLRVQQDDRWVLINRANTPTLQNVVSVEPVTAAISLVKYKSSAHLIHRGGWVVLSENVEEARQIGKGWIAFKQGYSWGLVTPMGYLLLPAQYDDILKVGPFILVAKDGAYAVTNEATLGQEKAPALQFLYDDYEWIRPGKLQVFAGDQEALLDLDLKELVPLADHQIYVNDKFWYIKSDEGYQIMDAENQDVMDQYFQYLEVNEGWMAFKKPDEWLLVSRHKGQILAMNALDSARLLDEQTAFITRGDTLQVVFQNSTRLNLSEAAKVQVLDRKREDRNSKVSYPMVQEGKEATLYDKNGAVRVVGFFDEVTLLRDSLFRVKKGEKVGLVTTDGEDILSADYDMLDERNGLVFLLRDGKIGCLDLDSGVFLPNQYETRIERFGPDYKIVKEGKTGLVNKGNEEVLPAAYDELIPWGDSTCWARQDAVWQLVNYNQEVLVDQVQSVKIWFEVGKERVALVRGPEGYGIHSSARGEILAMQYNDIVNLGTTTNPVFFAEEHVKTADFYVVTYFDRDGETIKSQAFRPEEYDLIYCDH